MKTSVFTVGLFALATTAMGYFAGSTSHLSESHHSASVVSTEPPVVIGAPNAFFVSGVNTDAGLTGNFIIYGTVNSDAAPTENEGRIKPDEASPEPDGLPLAPLQFRNR